MRKLFQIATLLTLCSITSCGVQTVQGGDGGATETVNAQVIISDSTVAVTITSDTEVYADVMIFDDNYNSVTQNSYCDSATGIRADSTITFGKLNGNFNILIHNRLTQKSIAFRNISTDIRTSDTITDTLSASGLIEGKVVYNDTAMSIKPVIKVYIRGTPYCTEADSNGGFQLSGIPRGNYFMKAVISNLKSDVKNSVNRSVGKEITIKSSITTDAGTLFFSE